MPEQGYYGTKDSPIEDLYSERKVMTPHSSDPGSLEEGEYRLRTDLNSGDRIATYELNVGNGVEEAPVFPVSESVGSNIVKVRHVYVPGEGWGFVPLGDTNAFTPAYEEFAFWHGGTRYGWHNIPTAFPDSGGTHQWNAIDGSGTALGDSIGSLDGAINGPQWVTGSGGAGDAYLYFDATDGGVDFGSSSQSEFRHFVEDGEGTVFLWINPDDTNPRQVFYGSSYFNSDIGFVIETRPSEPFEDYLKFQISDGDGNNITVATTSTDLLTTEWQPIAVSADGADAYVYHGDPSDDYSLSEVASAAIMSSNLVSSDLDHNVVAGYEGSSDSDHFGGGMDIVWSDNVGRSASALQGFVDDTAEFYE